MQRITKISVLAGLALALAVLAAACGGSSSSSSTTTAATESASDWANGVCGAMSTWVSAVQTAMDPVSKGNISKDSLSTAGDDLKSATTTFVDDIKSLGPPDTASGEQAKQEIDTLATELSTDADTIKSALNDISSGSGITAAVATISTTAQQMGTQAQTTVNNLKSLDAKGELKSAFENAPNCKTLSSSK
jgi:hypothetical protein